MSSEFSIKVENLSKCYHVYDRPGDRLKQFFLPRLRGMVGVDRGQNFREFWALRDVSFEVKKGETVGIIGRNGSGKSTLLQMICGTLNPTHGSVQTKGRIAALLELGSGFNPEFTGRENVYMNAAVLGLEEAEIDARFDEIAEFADIGEFIEQTVKSYSSGMIVRLAFAVQAMIDPDIFIVDEALAVGDEKFQRKCFARLEELKSKGTSILFVSHSAATMIELCDRTLFLEQGSRLMYSPAPQAIRAYQALIYAPEGEYERLLEKYRNADTSGSALLLDEPKQLVTVEDESVDAFDPGLIPETTTVYPDQGGIIEKIVILDDEGRAVNVLQAGKIYQFEVSGSFQDDFSGIYWGIHIRNISGAVVTGQRYPEEGVYMENVRAGSQFSVKFSFTMSLLPGAYFAGAGIWSAQEPNSVHRILDAIMFRVSPNERLNSFGYVCLASSAPAVEMN
ncbi:MULTISPECIES: ABC transporter ATP-binding protein [Pseudomonas syringae group]|uniref:ABC transporter-like protein n=5 Tax=Pseudomonas syringae group TaxID=136849 RepID=A0A0P9YZA2_PSESI|nr:MULTISPECIES: ABC transporter ATP-binding protein [Pseudomonas syringae group]MCF9016619.1 ATP-binding cassette domain-containing protein [Pseudomonas syringae]EKN45603.1 ABC transporter-like protein [Pseudomonas viridiflava UASWS0038]KPL66419.1 ABC transporter ATP-binding protein [Pseudomonas viridiflava]KPY51811.1 ABC transporter-like protein [Pseudomonas syringae pv. ribicola]KPZ23664.1 ABC transporter-like protein [Pseudomonas viridiflava]